MQRRMALYDFWVALGLAFVVFPYFFFGLKTPMMAPYSWALSDTVVSHMVFIPGLEAVKEQLFSNFQILWGPQRAMGLPLLANEIQAAPLYPIHLLLFPLPPQFFWPLAVLCKLVLSLWIALSMARVHFGFSRSACFIFALQTAFALYVLRYMNHPWHNAFVAGWAYLYLNLSFWRRTRPKPFLLLGLCLSSWGLIASGFPSATALMVLFCVLFLLPRLFRLAFSDSGHFARLTGIFLGIHLISLAIVSPTLASLFDLLSQTSGAFRENYGMRQASDPWLFLGMIHRFWNGRPPFEVIHVFRMIPVFLLIVGAFQLRKALWNTRRQDFWGLAFVLAFASLKYFPISKSFNHLIGSLPVLSQTHFVTYGLFFFIFPAAFLSSLGVEALQAKTSRKKLLWAFTIASLLFSAGVFHAHLREAEINGPRFAPLVFFLTAVGLIFWKGAHVFKGRILAVLCVCLLLEFLFTQPSRFLSTSSPFYEKVFHSHGDWTELSDLDQKEKINFRSDDEHGLNVGLGLYTADIGATAIMTERQELFRNWLFDAPWEGYLPIKKALHSYSFDLTATRFFQASGRSYDANKLIKKSTLLYDRPATLSRLYQAGTCHVVSTLEDAKSFLQQGFVRGKAVVESNRKELYDFCNQHSDEALAVDILRDQGSRIVLGEHSGPKLLVLSDNYYPGWVVRDRRTQETLQSYPANLNNRAIFLEETRIYDLVLHYSPPWLNAVKWSVAIGLLFFLALCVLTLVDRKKEIRLE